MKQILNKHITDTCPSSCEEKKDKSQNPSLLLADEGIFPITKDKHGNLQNPATSFPIAGTIQGEGKLMGLPVLFIRLAGCNLRCIWKLPDGSLSPCDTLNASFRLNGFQQRSLDEIIQVLKQNAGAIRHLVISGGEPTLQWENLALLCKRIKEELDFHITLETNGTIFKPELAEHIDLFSISPKLANATPTPEKMKTLHLGEFSGVYRHHQEINLNIKVLQDLLYYCQKNPEKDFQLKFVITGEKDAQEIETEVLNHLQGWKAEDILAMPLGGTQRDQDTITPHVLETAIRRGWRFCPRLHVQLFGDKKGV